MKISTRIVMLLTIVVFFTGVTEPVSASTIKDINTKSDKQIKPKITAQTIIKPIKQGLLKRPTNIYATENSYQIIKRGQAGDFYHFSKLIINQRGEYRLKLTNGSFIVADSNNIQQIVNGYKNYFIHKNSTGIIKLLKTAAYYTTPDGKTSNDYVKKGSFVHVIGIAYTKSGTPKLLASNGKYLTASRYFVKTSTGYQNPKQYFQIQNTRIKPTGSVGYTLKYGYEGVKRG